MQALLQSNTEELLLTGTSLFEIKLTYVNDKGKIQ